MVSSIVQKSVRKFCSFDEADKADREFYRNLSGKERLSILLQLTGNEPERRLERVYRVTNSRGVEHVIVGAHSFAFHAARPTPKVFASKVSITTV